MVLNKLEKVKKAKIKAAGPVRHTYMTIAEFFMMRPHGPNC